MSMSSRALSCFLVGVLLLSFTACGGGGSSSAPAPSPFNFDFDRFSYPGIVVLPLATYQSGDPNPPGLDRFAESPIINAVRTAAANATDLPFLADWDTMRGLDANGYGDDRDVMRFYLAYEVSGSPSSNNCTVTIHVFEGLPYDPSRSAIATYAATVTYGDTHRDGSVINDPSLCEDEAAHRATQALIAGGHFAEGWSNAAPQHSQP